MRRALADLAPAELAATIEADGYAMVADFVPESDLAAARRFTEAGMAVSTTGYFGVGNGGPLGGTFLEALRDSPEFQSLCRRLCTLATGREAPETGFYQILRALEGQDQARHALRFHYDSYVLTALLPILIPSGGEGRLILGRQRRPLRRSYAANLLDKLQVDNARAQQRLARRYAGGACEFERLVLKPGNLYFFWGYRTLHTNEPAPDGAIRATAVYHYLDPHAHAPLKRLLRRVRGS
ncbi:hypothetical protein [Novosphingobium mangrovi (ex Hu et al. 2023)]|uniref:Phytanoyl-CoA dioxygenase n=1 Tax=Novosphingobium mangrovi (ex Hu et al. 2023) TaxID=2930094 RepID=A0ABT0AIF8_9SPHN|nr:hypothetical protein [Novosphingobium mangrovi (ex Hu et al. 2023)]MCJ1962948.1 hypothetical protein [Novosphingobium mangrovi (ex Hu et al. 2023)]